MRQLASTHCSVRPRCAAAPPIHPPQCRPHTVSPRMSENTKVDYNSGALRSLGRARSAALARPRSLGRARPPRPPRLSAHRPEQPPHAPPPHRLRRRLPRTARRLPAAGEQISVEAGAKLEEISDKDAAASNGVSDGYGKVVGTQRVLWRFFASVQQRCRQRRADGGRQAHAGAAPRASHREAAPVSLRDEFLRASPVTPQKRNIRWEDLESGDPNDLFRLNRRNDLHYSPHNRAQNSASVAARAHRACRLVHCPPRAALSFLAGPLSFRWTHSWGGGPPRQRVRCRYGGGGRGDDQPGSCCIMQ